MVNILKFQTLVACKKGLDKHVRLFPVSNSDKQFVNSSPENQHFIWERKEKVFEILEHLA